MFIATSLREAVGSRMEPSSEARTWGEDDGEALGTEKEDMRGELLYDSAPEMDPVDE